MAPTIVVDSDQGAGFGGAGSYVPYLVLVCVDLSYYKCLPLQVIVQHLHLSEKACRQTHGHLHHNQARSTVATLTEAVLADYKHCGTVAHWVSCCQTYLILLSQRIGANDPGRHTSL